LGIWIFVDLLIWGFGYLGVNVLDSTPLNASFVFKIGCGAMFHRPATCSKSK